MAVKLTKNSKPTEDIPKSELTDLTISQQLVVQLQWQQTVVDEQIVDCDPAAFLLTEKGVVRGIQDFIFYNQLQHVSGAVIHFGDDLGTSSTNNSQEEINIIVSKIPEGISKIVFIVSIANAQKGSVQFSDIQGARIGIYDRLKNKELAFFNLSEFKGSETVMLFGELILKQNDWKFIPVNQGFSGGIDFMCKQYGVIIN